MHIKLSKELLSVSATTIFTQSKAYCWLRDTYTKVSSNNCYRAELPINKHECGFQGHVCKPYIQCCNYRVQARHGTGFFLASTITLAMWKVCLPLSCVGYILVLKYDLHGRDPVGNTLLVYSILFGYSSYSPQQVQYHHCKLLAPFCGLFFLTIVRKCGERLRDPNFM